MKLRVAKRLHDALVAGRLIQEFVDGRAFDDYERDVMLRSAVERQLEILSEALRVASARDHWLIEAVPEIPKIIAMRNRIAHSYNVLDDEVVWAAASSTVPRLVSRLEAILGTHADPSLLD